MADTVKTTEIDAIFLLAPSQAHESRKAKDPQKYPQELEALTAANLPKPTQPQPVSKPLAQAVQSKASAAPVSAPKRNPKQNLKKKDDDLVKALEQIRKSRRADVLSTRSGGMFSSILKANPDANN